MIEEVNQLINYLDICGAHAEEIINIYFECYAGENWDYMDYLRDEIRVVRDNQENQMLIAELQTLEDICLFEGDDYVLITNYQTLINMGEMGDCIPSSF